MAFERRIVFVVLMGLAIPGNVAALDLPGTAWRLVTIQSMDDGQGTTRIADPAAFTLQFRRIGVATIRLDCNRGTAGVRIGPAGDGNSGTLVFGPIATTRAACRDPALDARIARDLLFVRSYLVRDGNLYFSLMADGGIYEWAPHAVPAAGGDPDRIVKRARFPQGADSAVLRGTLVGRSYIDHLVRGRAGQTLSVEMGRVSNAVSFNVLPPGSTGVAMAIGDLIGRRYEGLLPDDGDFIVRVFLNRAAVRRGERADFAVSVRLVGTGLPPTPFVKDAAVPGTRYHATASTDCRPDYSKERRCEAYVVRRGFDSTATVELRWAGGGKRRILFVKGEPKASDSSAPMRFERNERGWIVRFGDTESFEIAEALVTRG